MPRHVELAQPVPDAIAGLHVGDGRPSASRLTIDAAVRAWHRSVHVQRPQYERELQRQPPVRRRAVVLPDRSRQSTAIWMFAGNTAMNASAARARRPCAVAGVRPRPRTRARRRRSRRPDARRRAGSACGTISSKNSGRTKCTTPAVPSRADEPERSCRARAVRGHRGTLPSVDSGPVRAYVAE